MRYIVEGTVEFNVEVEVHADTEEEALKLAKDLIGDMYHLDAYGAYHNPDQDVYYDLDAFEEED